MGKPQLLTAREAAAYRGITVRQVQRLAKSGLWSPAQVGARNTMYFRKGDIRYATTTLRGL